MCLGTIGYSLMKYHMHTRYFMASHNLKSQMSTIYLHTFFICTFMVGPQPGLLTLLEYNNALISHLVTDTSVSHLFWTCKFSLSVISLANGLYLYLVVHLLFYPHQDYLCCDSNKKSTLMSLGSWSSSLESFVSTTSTILTVFDAVDVNRLALISLDQ